MNQTRKLLTIPSYVSAATNRFHLSYVSFLDAKVFMAWVYLYSFYDLTWEELMKDDKALFKFPHLAFWLTLRDAITIKIKNYDIEGVPRVGVDIIFAEDDRLAASDLDLFRKRILKGNDNAPSKQ